MKRIILLGVVLMSISLAGFSQTEKGTLMIGGNGNIEFPDNDIEFRLNPTVGKFVADKFCVGLSLPLIYIDSDLYMDITPFARYYWAVKETRSFYVSGAIGLASLFDMEHKVTNNEVILGLGHVWFLTKNVGFEVEMQGRLDSEDVNLGMNMGFQIYLNKQK